MRTYVKLSICHDTAATAAANCLLIILGNWTRLPAET